MPASKAKMTAGESDFGALFVDCSGRGWKPGTFRLSEPEAVVEVREEQAPRSSADPFVQLESAIAERPDLIWAGFISYDAARCLEAIPSIAAKDRDIPLLGFAGFGRAEAFEPASAFGHTEPCFPATASTGAEDLLCDRGPRVRSEGAKPCDLEESLTHRDYVDAVQSALEHIRAGDFYQVNLARRISARAPLDAATAAACAFERIVAAVRPSRGCLLRWKDIFVTSASPELFLSVDGRRVTTRPIKGTRPRLVDAAVDTGPAELLSSEKERAENLMIVDLLRNDLGKVAEYASVRVPRLFEVESLPTVHHLVSTVTCTLRQDASLADLLRATFPGGSITGAPKVAAMQFIESVERVRRGIYTGAIGYIDPLRTLDRRLGIATGRRPSASKIAVLDGRMELSIAIRTPVLCGGWWDLWVGGGIVADSDPDAEWDETVYKSEGLASVLGKAAEITALQRRLTY